MFKVPVGWSRRFMAEMTEPYVTLGVPFRVIFYPAHNGVIRATFYLISGQIREYELTLPVGRN